MKHCKNCNKVFEPKNARQEYCRNACKTMYNRKKSGIPEPEFLQNQSKPKKAIGNLDIEGAVKQIFKPQLQETKAYKELAGNIQAMENRLSWLNNEKQNLIHRTRNVTRNDTSGGVLLGALIGGALGKEINKDTGFIVGLLGGGFIGYKLTEQENPSNLLTPQQQKQLSNLRQKINGVNNQIVMVEIALNAAKTQLRKTPRFTATTQNTPKTAIFSPTKKVMSANELMKLEFNQWQFEGKWGELIGNPTYGFSAIIFGKAGQGKSTSALEFAGYLANNHGKTLYLSSEEGISATMQNKVKSNPSKYLLIAQPKNLEDAKAIITDNNVPFVFIDSANHLGISAGELEELKTQNPTTSFITILQATKSGDEKGTSEFRHNADIVLKAENMGLRAEKNRFNALKEILSA